MLKARIKFRKYGCMKFIGHLDVMRFFQKVMRRADIPIAFSGGYSPHMIMSFAQPLGIGLTSDGEYLDIELTEPIDSKEAVARMNAVSVEGIEMVSMVQISEEKKARLRQPPIIRCFYWNQERVRMFEERFRLNGKDPGRSS